MYNFNYYSPTKVCFGKDEINSLSALLKEGQVKKLIIVYGKSSIFKNGIYDATVKQLNDLGIEYKEVGGVKPNPSIELVREGTKIAKEFNPDMILALGGGSVIDTAKAIASSVCLDCDPWDLFIQKASLKTVLPIGVVLTISAAGSELSNSCVISNEALNIKTGINSDLIRPTFAILDPTYTFSVSKYQTACGICDIMMHTLERYLVEGNMMDLIDNFSVDLIKTTYEQGKIAYNDPTNYDARANLMLASSFSHNGLTGLSNQYFFTVHKLEHALSGLFDEIAHGAGLSILFPAWAKVVYEKLPNKFANLGRKVFDLNGSDLKVAKETINCFEQFFKEINLPIRLSEVNVTEESFTKIANQLTKNNTTVVKGFVDLDYDTIMQILNFAK